MKTIDIEAQKEMARTTAAFFGRLPTLNKIPLTDAEKIVECMGIAGYLAKEFPYVKSTSPRILIESIYRTRFSDKKLPG